MNLNEIKKILKSYDFFCYKVNHFDALLDQLMASGQQELLPLDKSKSQEESKKSYNILDIDFFSNEQAKPMQEEDFDNDPFKKLFDNVLKNPINLNTNFGDQN